MLGRQCHASFIALHHHQFFHNWLDAVFLILDHPILRQFPQKMKKKTSKHYDKVSIDDVNKQLTFCICNESKQTAVLFGQKTW